VGAVLLDTTVLIDVLRGRPGAVARLRGLRDADDRPYVCAINVEEIQRGLRGEHEADAASRLFDGLGMVWLGRADGARAGTWRQTWAAQGVTLSQADCIIAAAALSIGGRLATGNPADFPMDGLQVEHWPVGE
jgi:predicted nucleic acid-binding protein